MVEPRITSIRIYSGPERKKPASGDRKVVKGVEYVRRPHIIQAGLHKGAWLHSGSRPCYRWIPVSECPQIKRELEHAELMARRKAEKESQAAADE